MFHVRVEATRGCIVNVNLLYSSQTFLDSQANNYVNGSTTLCCSDRGRCPTDQAFNATRALYSSLHGGEVDHCLCSSDQGRCLTDQAYRCGRYCSYQPVCVWRLYLTCDVVCLAPTIYWNRLLCWHIEAMGCLSQVEMIA